MTSEADMFAAAQGGPTEALDKAAAALNEVERFERIRYDASAEDIEMVVAGLAKVFTAADRICESLADRLPECADRAVWRFGSPADAAGIAQFLEETEGSLRQIGAQLSAAAEQARSAQVRLRQVHFDRPPH